MHLTMNEGLFAKHALLNGGALPTSAEDLAQKHQKLLQDYSRLKAQFTVLRKAVIKEQSTNTTLKNNLKEKEKELRKLQEELDLLSFHNERLTKRIEAVQEDDQKGSHFSLLGGAVKKELERSMQALNAMNVDLANKIEENERLHDELSENRHIYTDHINGLYLQIGKLEKRVEELQVEISSLQKDSRDQGTILKQEKAALQAEIATLMKEVEKKSRTLKESESVMKQGDIDLRSEIESLRAILLAKLGDLEGRDDDEDQELPKLSDVIPACEALKILEEQAKDYIYALREQTSLKGLPHEIAAKLKTSSKTWSEEMQRLAKRLEESEAHVKKLLEANKGDKTQTAEKIAALEATIDGLQADLSDRQEVERIDELRNATADLEKRNEELGKRNAELEDALKRMEVDLGEARVQLDQAHASKQQLEETFTARETTLKEQLKEQAEILAQANTENEKADKEAQTELVLQAEQPKIANEQADKESQTEPVLQVEQPKITNEQADKESQTEPVPQAAQDAPTTIDTNEDEEDGVFVYRGSEAADDQEADDDDEGDDDDVFVYRGEDAAEENANEDTASPEPVAEETTSSSVETSSPQEQQTATAPDTYNTAIVAKDLADDYKARETAIEKYYQSQIKQLTEQLGLADSKALRYSKLVHTIKERLATESEKRSQLEQDNENIHKELERVKEHLETTEKNYQAQISMMTLEILGQEGGRGSSGP